MILLSIYYQIKDVNDVEGLRQLAINNCDLLFECGVSKPPSRLELSDKSNIMQAISLHKVVLGTMSELSQFKEGLSVLGVCDALAKHSDLLYSYYCCKHKVEISSGNTI